MSTGGAVLHRPISDLMNYFSPNVFIFNGSAVMLTLIVRGLQLLSA
jgi:hypothetical protein